MEPQRNVTCPSVAYTPVSKKIFSGSKNIYFNFGKRSPSSDTLLRLLSCENEGKNVTPLDVWKYRKAAREQRMQTIVVGGRDFDSTGGPPNVHIVVYIHNVYQ